MYFCLPSLEIRATELLSFEYETTLKSVGGSFMLLRSVGLSIVSLSFMESPTLMLRLWSMGSPSLSKTSVFRFIAFRTFRFGSL